MLAETRENDDTRRVKVADFSGSGAFYLKRFSGVLPACRRRQRPKKLERKPRDSRQGVKREGTNRGSTKGERINPGVSGNACPRCKRRRLSIDPEGFDSDGSIYFPDSRLIFRIHNSSGRCDTSTFAFTVAINKTGKDIDAGGT